MLELAIKLSLLVYLRLYGDYEETQVNFYRATRRYNSVNIHLHTLKMLVGSLGCDVLKVQ